MQMTTPASQQVISSPQNLFSILSHNETIEMFAMAKDGLKISPSIIDKLDISPKAYYRALKQLKNAGLIEKRKDKAGMIMYFHTTFGSIVYQRNVVEMEQYAENLQKMQMIDTLKSAEKFSEADILKLTQEIMYNIPPAIFKSVNNNVDIIMSFDEVIQKLLEQIDYCKSEILVSTRICPEIVINKLLEKSKLGVKVKVVADIDLVKEYFRSQEKFVDNPNSKNTIEERKCIVANPWYPDDTINRRIADIPFGIIILDNSEVGIEMVNLIIQENSAVEFS
jgi:DNA-binding PadR family transcriptional regulator